MERPAKRRKLSGAKQFQEQDVLEQNTSVSRATPSELTDELVNVTIYPSTTINSVDSSSTTTAPEDDARQQVSRNRRGIYLLPRADTTITASLVQININNGSGPVQTTQIEAPLSATVLTLGVGTVTVSPVDTTHQTVTSNTVTSTTPFSSVSSGISTSSSFSVPANLTSSITSTGRTVTVTTISTLELSLTNGTIHLHTSTSEPVRTIPITSSRAPVVHTTKSADKIVTITDSPASIWTADYTTITGHGIATDSSGASVTIDGGLLSGAGSQSSSAAGPTTSSTSSTSSGLAPLTPQQQQVVGGVVGGVAGLAVILLIFFAFVRFYRRRGPNLGGFSDSLRRHVKDSNDSSLSSMSQQPSTLSFTGLIAAGAKHFQPHISRTRAASTPETEASIAESERGFRRIAGRKLPPVLSAGGDGYGGNYGVFENEKQPMQVSESALNEHRLPGSSFYHNRGSFYANRDSSSAPSTPIMQPIQPPAGLYKDSPVRDNRQSVATRDFASPKSPYGINNMNNISQLSLIPSYRGPSDGVVLIRPSPARSFSATSSPGVNRVQIQNQHTHHHSLNLTLDDDGAPPVPSLHHETPAENHGRHSPTPASTHRHDGLGLSVPKRDSVGRSLASQDGSRYSSVSRASMRSTPRFVENL